MARVSLQGNPCNTNGELPTVGSRAPDFSLVGGDLDNVKLSDFAGKKKLLNIVPSLDTSVCATSTKRFNQEAANRDDVVMLIVSADLPFAQIRFCESENTKAVKMLSMMRDRNFAKDYGVLIVDGPLAGITARAIVVIDENDRIAYTELVSEIDSEPDYDKAIKAVN